MSFSRFSVSVAHSGNHEQLKQRCKKLEHEKSNIFHVVIMHEGYTTFCQCLFDASKTSVSKIAMPKNWNSVIVFSPLLSSQKGVHLNHHIIYSQFPRKLLFHNERFHSFTISVAQTPIHAVPRLLLAEAGNLSREIAHWFLEVSWMSHYL